MRRDESGGLQARPGPDALCRRHAQQCTIRCAPRNDAHLYGSRRWPRACSPCPRPPAPPLSRRSTAHLPGPRGALLDLHQNPELSKHEEKTSAKIAERLRALGYEVTDHVGGFGVVGVMKNGKGPTVLVRADMDALPVEEKTGLPYASKVRVPRTTPATTVPVMHACGHDVHMTSLVGAARSCARSAKSRWRGTLVLVGQPAEEGGGGREQPCFPGRLPDALPQARLRHRPPRRRAAARRHSRLHAGLRPRQRRLGRHHASTGAAGHGSAPQNTRRPDRHRGADDPRAADDRFAREQSRSTRPSSRSDRSTAGPEHNIIPDEVKLQLTVRSYKPEVRAEAARRHRAHRARPRPRRPGRSKEPLVKMIAGRPWPRTTTPR